ncbi:MAG: hypothetical protein HRT88_18285 [Lentisphaeraceae bacterium]|nr:hypothetical protein [Lentisphaeraceae bacterium]
MKLNLIANPKTKVKTMMKFLALLILCHSYSLLAITPMDKVLKAGGTSIIECEYNKNESRLTSAYKFSIRQGTYRYKVYLPEEYNLPTEERHPVIFMQSPSGSADMTKIFSFAKRQKWIVIILLEPSDPSGTCLGSFLAAHDDAVQRLRILEGMKYVTGIDIASEESSVSVGLRPGFAGLILQNGGFYSLEGTSAVYRSLQVKKHIAVCLLFAENSRKASMISWFYKDFPKSNPMTHFFYPGSSSTAPEKSMEEALEWLQRQLAFSSKSKEICRWLFSRGLESLERIDTEILKYRKLEELLKISAIIRNDQVVKVKLPGLKQMYLTLKKNRQVIAELAAQKNYDRAFSKECKMRVKYAKGKLKSKKLSREIEQIKLAYKKVAAKYQGTVFGKKAEACQNQLTLSGITQPLVLKRVR